MLLLLACIFKQFLCFPLLRAVRGRIQAVIADTFGLDPKLMYLTKPTFFSRINSTTAKTQHDEYWHPHIDKVRHIMCLFFLDDFQNLIRLVRGVHYSEVCWTCASGGKAADLVLQNKSILTPRSSVPITQHCSGSSYFYKSHCGND